MSTRKILSVGIIVLAFMMITSAIYISILQSDNGKLKESIIEKDAIIASRDITITEVRTVNDELKADIEAMANQSQQVREELKVFQHKYDELATVDTRLINRVKKVINFCNDETFIPDLLRIVAILEKIIMRAE